MITKQQAIEIAQKHHGCDLKRHNITHGVPSNYTLYGSFSRYPDDVWCITYSKCDCISLRSSDCYVISKETGAILYSGSANDEG